LDSRFNFRGSGKQGTCFQICLKQLREALEIQGAISDSDLFWTAVTINRNFDIVQAAGYNKKQKIKNKQKYKNTNKNKLKVSF